MAEVNKVVTNENYRVMGSLLRKTGSARVSCTNNVICEGCKFEGLESRSHNILDLPLKQGDDGVVTDVQQLMNSAVTMTKKAYCSRCKADCVHKISRVIDQSSEVLVLDYEQENTTEEKKKLNLVTDVTVKEKDYETEALLTQDDNQTFQLFVKNDDNSFSLWNNNGKDSEKINAETLSELSQNTVVQLLKVKKSKMVTQTQEKVDEKKKNPRLRKIRLLVTMKNN